MERAYLVTVAVSVKNSAAGYRDAFVARAEDPQMVKYQLHKHMNENYPDVTNAKGSHTFHINGDTPMVQRLIGISPVANETAESGPLPLEMI